MPKRSLTRWDAAGWFWAHAPDWRGRDRVLNAIKGGKVPRSLAEHPTTIDFGPGIHCTVSVTTDSVFVPLFFTGYIGAALSPILDAVLQPGDCCYGLGANLGVYSLWAAKLVGADGEVHAFEPVEATRGWMERLVAENDATNITIHPIAVSDRTASVAFSMVEHHSGIGRVEDDPSAGPRTGTPDNVIMTEVMAMRVDDFVIDHTPPTLIKIDVEGHERAVFSGMTETLTNHLPIVVFESPDSTGKSGDTEAIVGDLRACGYRVWSLTPKGLDPYRPEEFSHNLLALHSEAHEAARRHLLHTRFPRQQNW